MKNKVYVIVVSNGDWCHRSNKILGFCNSEMDANFEVARLREEETNVYYGSEFGWILAEEINIDRSSNTFQKYINKRVSDIDKSIESRVSECTNLIRRNSELEMERIGLLSYKK